MCCDHLVCAHCARPVSEGGCAVCRAARAQMHHSTALSLPALIALVTALLLLAVVLSARLSG